MLVLHMNICDEQAVLWGEISAPRHQQEENWHPFAADAEDLRSQVSSSGVSLTADKIQITAWLPSRGNSPVPSTPLLAESSIVYEGQADIHPWRIEGLLLSAEKTVQLVAACRSQRTLTRGVIVGSDLQYWAGCLPFATQMAAAGRFLPDISECEGVYRATWKPVFFGDDAGKRSQLAGDMPAACRALTHDSSTSPATPPPKCLDAFISVILSGLATADRPAPVTDLVCDLWLRQLQASDAEMKSETEDLKEHAALVRTWHRSSPAITMSTPASLVFQLEEPTDENDCWTVNYLLRCTRDPGVVLFARQVWQGPQALADLDAETVLLAQLGRAAAVSREVKQSLGHSQPCGFQMNRQEAYHFLTESAPALHRAGFSLMLPSWWTETDGGARLKTQPHFHGADARSLSLDEIISVDWEVALDGTTLTRGEVEKLAELKVPLVHLRGNWVRVTEEDLDMMPHILEAEPEKMSAREALPLALRNPASSREASGWFDALLRELSQKQAVPQVPQPEGFQGQLRPYQLLGYSWLNFLSRWGLGGCLADDMGLGKTVQILALLQKQHNELGPGTSLVVCPTSVLASWRQEAGRFVPGLSVLMHHGPDRETNPHEFASVAGQHSLVLTSYGLLSIDDETLGRVKWRNLILDEAQNIKNPDTQRARAAGVIDAGFRVALTGTPVENRVRDLWSIMEFLNPGLLGSRTEFRQHLATPIQIYRDAAAMQTLKGLTSPFILRREKTDPAVIDDLPEKMQMKVTCSLTGEQASLYAASVQKARRTLQKADGMSRRGIILSTLTELKQICNHPALLDDGPAGEDRSGKMARLTGMLAEVFEMEECCLIFTQFVRMGQILKKHLEETFGYRVLFLQGSTPAAERNRMVQQFQQGGTPFFVLSLRAGGTGLNLTAANHVFHVDRWWNPAVENQATDRAFRIGQTDDVYVHKFVTAGTVEEKIDEMIVNKKQLADEILDSTRGEFTEMSTEEFTRAIALRKEVLGGS